MKNQAQSGQDKLQQCSLYGVIKMLLSKVKFTNLGALISRQFTIVFAK